MRADTGPVGRMAGHLGDVRQHARGGGLAVGAGDRGDRHPRRRARREQHVDHRPRGVARGAFAGGDVHAEAGRGVDLADRAADVLVALGDVGGDEVDAANVEPDRAHRAHRHVAVVGMDDVGDVGGGAAGGQVGGGAQVDDLVLLRHGIRGVADALQHQLGLRVELQPRQHLLVADAAARILVHPFQQFGDGVAAVADHVPRRALGRGDQFAVDHQQAVVVAGLEGLDDHRARVLARGDEGLADLVVAADVDGDAAAVVAVVGFGHHRCAEPTRRTLCLLDALHEFLARHRQTERAEDLVGLFLVAGELDRDMRGASGDSRLDALLVLAVAELDQRLLVQPQPGDAALLGRPHQRRRRRPQRAALGVADEVVARGLPLPVVGHAARRAQFVRQQRLEQGQRQFPGGDALLLLLVFVHDRVHAGAVVRHAAGLAEGDVFAGHVLQLDRRVLEHVPQPGALTLAHPAHEAAGLAVGAAVLGQPRQRRQQAVDEGRPQLRRRPSLQLAEVQLQPDHREMRVQRRADVDGAVEDAHRDSSGISQAACGERRSLREY
jgi:hypothetical protein